MEKKPEACPLWYIYKRLRKPIVFAVMRKSIGMSDNSPEACSSSPPPSHSLRDLPIISMSDLYRGDHTGQLFRVELNGLEDMMMYLEYLKPSTNEPGLMEIASEEEVAQGCDTPKAVTPAQLKKSLLVQGGAIIDKKLAEREAHLLQEIRTLESTLRGEWTKQVDAVEARFNDTFTEKSDELENALETQAAQLDVRLQDALQEQKTVLEATIEGKTSNLDEKFQGALDTATDELTKKTAGIENALHIRLPALGTELRSSIRDTESRIRGELNEKTVDLEGRLTTTVEHNFAQTQEDVEELDAALTLKVNSGISRMERDLNDKERALRRDIDDQLLTLRTQIRLPPIASETQKGIVQLATQTEVNQGYNNAHAITPRALAMRLACLRSEVSTEIDEIQRSIPHTTSFPARANGYQLLPSGLIIQWGGIGSIAGAARRIQFPISFSYKCYALCCTSCHTIPQAVSVGNVTIYGFKIYGDGNYWIAIGC